MVLGIVGGGTVGRATARAFIEHVDEVRVYDCKDELRTHSVDDVLGCEIVFICLPTPQKAASLECDTSYVEGFLGSIISSRREQNLVIRSTVPIGFTKRMRHKFNLPNLTHSPEFLTARCSLIDAQIPSRNIIGYSNCVVPQTGPSKNSLKALYQKRFPSVPLLEMTSDESEAIKLVQNSFFACKISFWNECRTLTDKLGLNWEAIINGILADGRISPSHTQVPGYDGHFGYGGVCLPKDIADLISCFEQAGVGAPICQAAYARNLVDRQR